MGIRGVKFWTTAQVVRARAGGGCGRVAGIGTSFKRGVSGAGLRRGARLPGVRPWFLCLLEEFEATRQLLAGGLGIARESKVSERYLVGSISQPAVESLEVMQRRKRPS